MRLLRHEEEFVGGKTIHPIGRDENRFSGLILVGTCVLLASCGGSEATGPDGGGATKVASVDLTPAADTLTAVGATVQFSASATDEDGSSASGLSFTWSSSDETVVSVDQEGLATARAGGTATITATAQGVRGEASLTVNQELRRLVFDTQPTAAEGQVAIEPAVTVVLLDSLGNRVTDAATPVTISLSDDPTGGRAVLTGSATVESTGGVARFHDLSIDLPGDGYTLAASAVGLSTASVPFSVHLTFSQLRLDSEVSCAVTVADRGYCWGYNAYGQLGDGSTEDTAVPVPISGRLSLAGVSPGETHSCGVTTGSRTHCWGQNLSGQLGDATTDDSRVPVAVEGPSLESVSTGESHACGLRLDGSAYCWGENAFGQLGDDGTDDSSIPTPVDGSLTFAEIDIGDGYTCGLTPAGDAYCWGRNRFGNLGNGTTDDTSLPVPVDGPAFAAITVGGSHACGLTPNGAAYCWGANFRGALGDGTTVDRHSPVAVHGTLQFTVISADSHTCGVTNTGSTYCWGDGRTAESDVPVLLGGPAFVEVSVGGGHACGRTAGGAVYCWGSNDRGQLGDGTTDPHPTPEPVVQ